MSVDIEAGGALTTAGLAAKVIDGEGGKPSKGHGAACANCGTALAGSYCHACGQFGHVHRSIWHMIEEGFHGLLHFDSKTWRTLPLLLARPGLLTRRYIDGQRVRYVQPLALFLFTMFLMFFVASFGDDGKDGNAAEQLANSRAELLAEIGKAKGQVGRDQAQLARARSAEDRAEAQVELIASQEELRGLETALSVIDQVATSIPGGSGQEPGASPANVDLDNLPIPKGPWTEMTKDPELAAYRFKNTAYKFSFMLIPISLPFIWLMFFWRKDVTAYDHIIFSLYSLSFMSLWFIVVVLASASTFTEPLVPFLFFVPPLHIFLHLRETYRLGVFSTLWRTFALLVSAGTASLMFLIFIVALVSM